MEKPHIDRPILVEGKYDKITILSAFRATVLTTDGFGIFNKKEKQALLLRLASEKGLIVLTDPDGAGRVIRGFLSGILPKEKLIHVYAPMKEGKERRKAHRGKAGLLGVEGMDKDTVIRLLSPYADGEKASEKRGGVTKTDFYEWGLSGGENARTLRDRLAVRTGLPTEMSANAMIEALNLLFCREEVLALIPEISSATS